MRVGHALPIEVVREGAVPGMAGDILETTRVLAIGERKAKPGGRTLGGGDAGHHLNRDIRHLTSRNLFGRAAENKRVATLQAHNTLALARKADHQLIDVFLLARGAEARLADQKFSGFAAGKVENLAEDQVVKQDHVG